MAKFLDFLHRLQIPNLSTRYTYTEFSKQFFSSPYHQWINERPMIRKNLETLFKLIPGPTLWRLNRRRFVIAPCNGNMSATISLPKETNVILLFPDLITNLESANPADAYAIIAHELGHIFFNHSKQNMSAMRAQHEADLFACQLGLFEEMESLLGRSCSSELTERLYFIRKMQKTI